MLLSDTFDSVVRRRQLISLIAADKRHVRSCLFQDIILWSSAVSCFCIGAEEQSHQASEEALIAMRNVHNFGNAVLCSPLPLDFFFKLMVQGQPS